MDLLLFHPDDLKIFQEAKAAKIHRSVHAGEFGPSEAVFQAIEKLCAERIVFGYSVLHDESLYQDCINNKIHFCTAPSVSLVNGSVGQTRYNWWSKNISMKYILLQGWTIFIIQ